MSPQDSSCSRARTKHRPRGVAVSPVGALVFAVVVRTCNPCAGRAGDDRVSLMSGRPSNELRETRRHLDEVPPHHSTPLDTAFVSESDTYEDNCLVGPALGDTCISRA